MDVKKAKGPPAQFDKSESGPRTNKVWNNHDDTQGRSPPLAGRALGFLPGRVASELPDSEHTSKIAERTG